MHACHNRRLDNDSSRLWEKIDIQAVKFEYEIDLCKTHQRNARRAKLAVRCCRVELHRPSRLASTEPLQAEGVTERLKSMLYKVYGSNAFKVK